MNRQTMNKMNERSRGSVILMVVVVLVLMAMLGAAYIQVARMDRIATRLVEANNIDTVARMTVIEIADILREDMLNGGEERMDYPWTNPNPSSPRSVELRNQAGTVDVIGGDGDDPHLGSTIPDFSGGVGEPRWDNLTILSTPIFLRIPTATSQYRYPGDDPGGVVAGEDPLRVGATDWFERNSNLLIDSASGSVETLSHSPEAANWEPLGADATFDDVPDSRWQWAPIRQIGGVNYVIAVRIIDNSSMINANIATGLTSDGQNAFAVGAADVDIPRGYLPASVDLTRLLGRHWVDTAATPVVDWQAELGSLFGQRNVNTASLATPFGTPDVAIDLSSYPAAGSYGTGGRLAQWLDRGRMYGDRANQFAAPEELEIRYRGGLNNSRFERELEALMPGLMRTAEVNKTTIMDVDYPSAVVSDDQKRLAYYQGLEEADPDNANAAIATRVFPAQRHMLTTRSGAVPLAPNYAGQIYTDPANPLPLKYDLVHKHRDADGNYDGDRVTEMADLIGKVLKIGPDPDKYHGIADENTLDAIAIEYALAIQDYSDADHTPSTWAGASVSFYGMETLPFMRQVYVQAGYEDTDDLDGAGVPSSDGAYAGEDGTFDTWIFVPDSQAIAIEIGNPFDRTIAFDTFDNDGPEVRLRMVTKDDEEWLYPLEGRIESGKRFVVYCNPMTAIDEGGIGSDVFTDMLMDQAPTNLTKTDAASVDNTTVLGDLAINVTGATGQPPLFKVEGQDTASAPVLVELQVKVDATTWVTYDRFTDDTLALPQRTGYTPEPTDKGRAHMQVSAGRDGQTKRYLSNAGRGLVANRQLSETVPPYQIADNHDINEDIKAGRNGDGDLDFMQIPIPSRPIFSVAELGWTFMLGFYIDSGDDTVGDLPQRLDQASTTAVPREEWFLDIRPGATVPPDSGVPHAAMLLGQFTTLSPAHDDVDNNNDLVVDDAAERFVPGTININTAPLHLLTLAAPLPEPIADVEALMKSVVDYRDLVARPATVRQRPGIASMGELMAVNPVGGTTADMQQYNNTTPTNDGLRLYPMPEENVPLQPDITGPQSDLARFQFLSQAFTTRSDVYTAYIYVRGYPAGDWRNGPVEAKRLFVVFDRSDVTDATSRVRILGVFEYDR